MEIIKRGEIPPTPTKTFECNKCGTIFKAKLGEYYSCSQIEYLQSGSTYQCKCPICGKMVYIRS